MSVRLTPLPNLLGVSSCLISSLNLLALLTLLTDNHAQLSRASLRIRILDVNDNPPELATPYEAAVCEDAKPGQVPRGTGDQGAVMPEPPPHLILYPAPFYPTAYPDYQRGGQR